MKVDFARVSSITSSQDTDLDIQIQILKRYVECIFTESQSGSSTDKRLQLKEFL